MPSFAEILKRHSAVLLIDSASATVQVGLFRRGQPALWTAHVGEAGEQTFALVSSVLAQAGATLDDADAFVFCDGPGSVLGIRTAAVALRTWNMLKPRALYAYCGLSVVAQALASQGRRDFSVIADARRDSWHKVTVDGAGAVHRLCRVPTGQLQGALVMPEGFRAWTSLPAGLESVSYVLADLLPEIADADLFYDAPAPDAFLHEEPVYQTWTPQVHRAPS